MGPVLESPRNSSARRHSARDSEIPPKGESLTFLQPSSSQSGPQNTIWEEPVARNRGLGSAGAKDALVSVKPLPWRQCAALMVLASMAVYGLGFLIVAGFNHLFHYLQL